MRPRKPDSSFLFMAAIAATGGVLAIVFSIGMPLWMAHQGHGYNPAFTLFSAWGIAALCGSYACLKTYFLTDTPPSKPPGGGVRLEFRRQTDAASSTGSAANPAQRRAA